MDFLVLASLGLAALQVYLTTNRLWKRKHERAVAESISIMGEFVGFVPVAFLTLKFTLDGQWAGVADGIIWVVGAGIAVLIGTGRWVEGRRERNLLELLREAIQVERGEVGYLARSFIRPSGASRILRILGRVALLDDELDAREKEFVESFARGWGIQLDWDSIPAEPGDNPLDFLPLRMEVQEYLATSPPPTQVRQLGDVLRALVGIDQTVTRQESVMLAELEGMIHAYLDDADEDPALYSVVLVPQGPEQDQAIASVLPGLTRRELHGGQVYVAGSYHSFDFAEIVSTQYRALSFFTAVVRTREAAEPQAA